MDVDINLVGVLAAGVAAMVVGSIWYAPPVFGNMWLKLAKLEKKDWDKMGWTPMVAMFVLSLVMAYVLAHVAYLSSNFYTDYTYLGAAVSSAFWMWLGFVVPTVVGGGMFAARRKKLLAIDAGNWLTTLLVMGLVIGAIGL